MLTAPLSRAYSGSPQLESYTRADVASDRLWNSNIQYHDLILRAIPAGARRVLDVGCGDGILTAQVARAGVAHVVGLDLNAGVLERARARHPGTRIEWVHGDVLSVALEARAFDAVVSVAALHHMDARSALKRLADLAAPDGVLAIVGLAAYDWWDLPYEGVALGARTVISAVRGYWEHSAPMAWPPPATYSEMKRIASEILPGVRYRRHLLGRYSLIWRKPSLVRA